MQHELKVLRDALVIQIKDSPNLENLEELRVGALGKKGSLTELMKGLGKLAESERRDSGTALNNLKNEITSLIEIRKKEFEAEILNQRLKGEKVDVTLPERPFFRGSVHPIAQAIDEMMAIFGSMGFEIRSGPEIEEDFYNFTALNIPPEHPARQMHDTFYLPDGDEGERKLLRTHTSPVQIRTMIAEKPPHRIIAPGRTYRRDYDITHTPMFHQIEGLVVDNSTHMGHLKGCLKDFVSAYFEVEDLQVRFRPSYFPFTEPSAEMDIGCSREKGQLILGGGKDWMEILGCGMVNPLVLKGVGLNPDEYQGFAFGLGVERLAMLKYGIPDLRAFFDSDMRWLKHYGFMPIDVPSLISGLSR